MVDLWIEDDGAAHGTSFDDINNPTLERVSPMNAKIELHPGIMMGKPVVAGTRITVELILEKLGAGETVEDLLAAHPRLTHEAIRAALSFAARSLRNETECLP